MAFWSELPFDVLEQIAEKLGHNDLTQFGSVCKWWRLLYLQNLSRLPKEFPLALCHPRPLGTPILLLSCKPMSNSRDYVSLQDGAVKNKIFLPEATDKWICGSSWGWLVLVDIRGIEVCLYNPLTKSRIQLPSLDSFPILINAIGFPDDAPRDHFQFITKATLSSDPTLNSNDCIIMAIVGNIRRLCFCKLGDNIWTKVAGSPSQIQDVVYYDDKFYAINQVGTMVSYRGKDPNAESKVMAFGPRLPSDVPKRYLVVTEGYLLQVLRYQYSYFNHNFVEDENEDDNDLDDDNDNNGYIFADNSTRVETGTFNFDIFKLVKKNTPQYIRYVSEDFKGSMEYDHKWIKMESLNGHSLFLGTSGSLSIPAQLLPSCNGNRIYFTDDHDNHIGNLRVFIKGIPIKAYHDIGFFDIDDKSVTNYHPNDPNDIMPAVWVTPNPW